MTKRTCAHECGHGVHIEHHNGGDPSCVMEIPADWNNIGQTYCANCQDQIRLH